MTELVTAEVDRGPSSAPESARARTPALVPWAAVDKHRKNWLAAFLLNACAMHARAPQKWLPIVRESGKSETRLRSFRAEELEVVEVEIDSSELADIANEERPTLVPAEAVNESLEARLLFEMRAEEERRHAQASNQNERPTARTDAKRTLLGIIARELPPPPVATVRWEPPIEEVEEVLVAVANPRRTAVRVIALIILLGVVAAVLGPILRGNVRAIQRAIATLTSRARATRSPRQRARRSTRRRSTRRRRATSCSCPRAAVRRPRACPPCSPSACCSPEERTN